MLISMYFLNVNKHKFHNEFKLNSMDIEDYSKNKDTLKYEEKVQSFFAHSIKPAKVTQGKELWKRNSRVLAPITLQ